MLQSRLVEMVVSERYNGRSYSRSFTFIHGSFFTTFLYSRAVIQDLNGAALNWSRKRTSFSQYMRRSGTR